MATSVTQFRHQIVHTIDQLLPGTGINDFTQVDPKQAYLRDVMHFNDAQIQNFRAKAEAFYCAQFGLDFTQVTADSQNVKNISGATLVPFRINPQVRFAAQVLTQEPGFPADGIIRDGGFFIVITGPGVTYHGVYGGAEGKPAAPGELIVLGFYNIAPLGKNGEVDENGDPLIIDYHAMSPLQRTADNDIVLHCQVQHPEWGIGVGRGIQLVSPVDSTQLRVMQRSIVTFPAGVAP